MVAYVTTIAESLSPAEGLSPYHWRSNWLVEMDWDGDGIFEGGNEDATADTVSFRLRRGRDAELDRAIPGTCEILLRNDTGKYSPANSSSPLFDNMKPGRKVRVRAVSPVSRTVFMGYVEDIVPRPHPREKTCYLRAVDGAAQVLAIKNIRSSLFADKGAGAAVGDVLDRAGWPAADRTLDAGQTTFPWWWAHDVTALEAAQRVAEAELGLFLVGADGFAVYEDRHHRLKGAHLVSQATVSATMVDLEYQSRLREIKNEATIKVYPRVTGSAGTELWRLRDTPLLAPQTRSFLPLGASATVTATAIYYADYSDPASTVITPVATTDYALNSKADGTGTALTSQLTVAILTSFGQGATISVTNNGPSEGYLTLLRVRGTPEQAPDAVTVSQGDVTAQTAYGRRTWALDNVLVQDALQAQDFADWVAARLKDGVAYLVVKLANVSTAMLQTMIERDISDRVTIVEGNTGVNGAYMIERVELQVEGTEVLASWLCSKADPLKYWILGEVGYSELGDTTRLAA